MLDAGSLDARGELRADLLGEQWRDLPAEERGDLLGFDAQHGLANELLIERTKRSGGTERQVGGVFHLHQASVVELAERLGHRVALRGIAVQRAMQLVERKGIRQFLAAGPVIDPYEGVVGHDVADALRGQLARQSAMAVAVELEAEQRQCRDPQIDQPEPGVLEVEIIVQALPAVRPHEGLVRLLVMSGLVSIAGFHRREDVHQPGAIAALLQHPRNNILLADKRLADVPDGHPGLSGQRYRTFANPIPQRHRKLWVVEDANPIGMQEARHPIRVAHPRKRFRDHHQVVAGQHARDLLVVALHQCLPHVATRQMRLLPGQTTPDLLVAVLPA